MNEIEILEEIKAEYQRARYNAGPADGKTRTECDKHINAIESATAALRDKLEREKNEPLTIEELCKMDGKPVFIVVDDVEQLRMWALVEYVAVAHCVVLTNNLGGRSEYYDEGDLAVDGLTIYRHPLKTATPGEEI